jgi:hypothetical protein
MEKIIKKIKFYSLLGLIVVTILPVIFLGWEYLIGDSNEKSLIEKFYDKFYV